MGAPKTVSAHGNGDHEPDKPPGRSKKKSKTKAKTKSEGRSRDPRASDPAAEPRPSAAETVRRNGSKSKGPRTEAGKARARYNALTHGMTARSDVLPGEDAAEFEARRLAFHIQIRPRNPLEAGLVDRLARDSWLSERTKNSAAARLEYRIRHLPLEQARAEEQSVAKLGQYLLKELFRPAGVLQCEREGGVRHPALLVLKLEATLTGCDWLLARFGRLRERAQIPGNWLEDDGFELVRLLGKYRGELTRDDLVAMVLLDSACLAEESVSRKLAHQSAKHTRRPWPRPTPTPRSRRPGPPNPYQPEAPARNLTSSTWTTKSLSTTSSNSLTAPRARNTASWPADSAGPTTWSTMRSSSSPTSHRMVRRCCGWRSSIPEMSSMRASG